MGPKKIIFPYGIYYDRTPWEASEVENLLEILEPLRVLTGVLECEIQLPASVQGNLALKDVVQRYIRGIKGEEPFFEEELENAWYKFHGARGMLESTALDERNQEEEDRKYEEENRQEAERVARAQERKRRREILETCGHRASSRWVRTVTDSGIHREAVYQIGPNRRAKNKRKGRRKGLGTGRK